LEKYTTFEYLGVNWTLIPDVTIPTGMCYPILNRPVGRILRKPSFNQEFTESNPRKNWETRSMTEVFNLVLIEAERPFALRVKYNSAWAAISSNE
jgi:hypothetical protein